MSLNQEQAIFLQHVARLIDKTHELGLVATGGELLRTPEQQRIHVRDGRSKTMDSRHLQRMAIDLNFFRPDADGTLRAVHSESELRPLGAFWESLDPANRWGGSWRSFKDLPHFERRAQAVAVAPPAATSPPTRKPVPPRGARLLADTVGERCRNLRDDVETVQRLLNLRPQEAGLDKPLTPDGLYGPNTGNALRAFQQSALGPAEPAGLVKPGDATLLALCATLPGSLDAGLLGLALLRAAPKDLAELGPELLATLERHQITTPLRQGHFLAQLGHESGELRFRSELASGRAYEGRRDLGNTQPGDGARYKGRGLIQLTGRANYTDYAKENAFGVDVVADPEQVARDVRLCVDVAGWFWSRKQLNLLADRDDLEGVTRRVNGGLNGLEDRRRLRERLRALLPA